MVKVADQVAELAFENGLQVSPAIAKSLMPTPSTMDHLPVRSGEAHERQLYRGGSKSRRSTSGNLREDIVYELPKLLPTTRTSMKNGATKKELSAGNPKSRIEAVTNWGKYKDAIERWEKIIGRKAPDPTKPDGKSGAHRLSSKFTEWMMGLPDGWITDTGLTRAIELKACGNGVVPQQAKLALQILLENHER